MKISMEQRLKYWTQYTTDMKYLRESRERLCLKRKGLGRGSTYLLGMDILAGFCAPVV